MWTIDRIEPPYAICEEDGSEEVKRILTSELPEGFHEGDVLRKSPRGWCIDRLEMENRRRRLSLKIKNLFGN